MNIKFVLEYDKNDSIFIQKMLCRDKLRKKCSFVPFVSIGLQAFMSNIEKQLRGKLNCFGDGSEVWGKIKKIIENFKYIIENCEDAKTNDANKKNYSLNFISQKTFKRTLMNKDIKKIINKIVEMYAREATKIENKKSIIVKSKLEMQRIVEQLDNTRKRQHRIAVEIIRVRRQI